MWWERGTDDLELIADHCDFDQPFEHCSEILMLILESGCFLFADIDAIANIESHV
jgi:hypothetical protein